MPIKNEKSPRKSEATINLMKKQIAAAGLHGIIFLEDEFGRYVSIRETDAEETGRMFYTGLVSAGCAIYRNANAEEAVFEFFRGFYSPMCDDKKTAERYARQAAKDCIEYVKGGSQNEKSKNGRSKHSVHAARYG